MQLLDIVTIFENLTVKKQTVKEKRLTNDEEKHGK